MKKRYSAAAAAVGILMGIIAAVLLRWVPLPGAPAAPSPSPSAPPPAEVDASRLNRGVISVRYLGMFDGKVKVQITPEGKESRNYDLNVLERWETFPLTEGDGSYTLTVLEHVEEDKYRPVFRGRVDLVLDDPLAPFLEPNQRVNFGRESSLASLAAELTAGASGDAEKAGILFDYVVDHMTYDKTMAEAVKAGEMEGYISDPQKALDTGKGICLDYAVLLCALLRSADIPCKLEAGTVIDGAVHAWVEVWSSDSGVIDEAIPVEADTWTLLDPTFVSNRARSPKIMAYVTNRENYTVTAVY